ncbi:Na+/H+ antiporter NhaA [Sphingomonas sp.]|uniref:Na+/H+ antiporter NhaA n=1 Tax=Sphingomonas sp. TaxID=28214 RepID=UPI002DD62CFB|nr:Na+/H+ antiporter NhaA [Sphingomonas sp.]
MVRDTIPPGQTAASRAFFQSEAAGGVVLMAAAAVAMIVANTVALSGFYDAALHYATGPVLNPKLGPMTIHLWINDGLMAIFFLLVGLEIKREVTGGRLSTPDARRLPVIAAIAGMAVPALIYLAVTQGTPGLTRGWAIPAATDIAFAIGVLALLGSRAPPALKLFLTTVAIVDDMGAVAIIAVAYTDSINVAALAGAAVVVGLMYVLNRRGVRSLWPYMAGFALLWLLTLMSGVHATIAGVMTAMLVPAGAPLERLEHRLNPWVAFLIVPLFGFANAGVRLFGMSLETLAEPVVLGIAAGLVVGKQLGIFGAIWIAVKAGIAPRPTGAGWAQIYGVSAVAGIGFTMSLFIGALAFPGDPLLADRVKLGVLAGSLLSGAIGYLVLRFAHRRTADA